MEPSATLQPVRLASGLWFPCAGAACLAIVALDSKQTPGRWEALRAGAFGAAVDAPNLHDAAMGIRRETVAELSRFYGCGSEAPLPACRQVIYSSLFGSLFGYPFRSTL